MKALQLVGWKQDPELRELPDPEPGPGEVVIEVAAAGACHSDLHLLHDFEAGMVPFEPPFTLGHENAGRVHALGAGVNRGAGGLEIGQPVAVYGPWGCGRCHRCRMGMENYCENAGPIGAGGGGLGRNGGMAEYMLVPSDRFLVPIGDLDPVSAAPLTDAGLTPYHGVKRSLHLLGAGSHAVVIGCGGLGHMAVQILVAMTATEVIAVDSNPEALEVARSAGAAHTVRAGESAAEEVRELTGGKGADVVLDVVGVDETLALAAAVSRPLGHLTILGIGGGSLPVNFFSVPYELSVATTYWGSLPELMEVIALAQRGQIRPEVTVHSLDDAVGTYASLAAGEVRGRAVISPAGAGR
ncbi:MAG: NAD(P)-dependent alcohol dehydrogenase [Microthrixaceae bacterium]